MEGFQISHVCPLGQVHKNGHAILCALTFAFICFITKIRNKMKKLVLLVALTLSASGVMAQQTIETVYLKNGGLVKGEIIEQVPGQSLKVKTKDGNIFVYQMDEVERITKEADTSTQASAHRGLDFSVDLGYNINTKGGGGSLAAELELGKRFSKSFYWGIGGGAYIPTGDGDPIIPITTDFKAFMPMNNSRIAPFVGLKAGYVLNTASDQTVGSGRYKQTVEMPDYIMVQVMPGIQFPLSGSVDFNFGAGYTHFIPASGGDGFGAIAIRAGFGFHKSNIRKTKLPPIPTRNRGFQVTLEGGKMGFGGDEYDGFAGNIVLSYKLNPNLSIGIGGGIDAVDTYLEEGVQEDLVRSDGSKYNYVYDTDISILAAKAFIRGQYRLTDKRFSPFVSCDAGMRFYSYDGSYNGWGDSQSIARRDEVLGEPPSSALFVSPAIGLSLRTFNNSYLELKAGYSLSAGVKEKHVEDEYTTSAWGFQRVLDRESASFSAPYVMLSWTHTFGSRKR